MVHYAPRYKSCALDEILSSKAHYAFIWRAEVNSTSSMHKAPFSTGPVLFRASWRLLPSLSIPDSLEHTLCRVFSSTNKKGGISPTLVHPRFLLCLKCILNYHPSRAAGDNYGDT